MKSRPTFRHRPPDQRRPPYREILAAVRNALTDVLEYAEKNPEHPDRCEAERIAAAVYGWQAVSLDQILIAPPPRSLDARLRRLVRASKSNYYAYRACGVLVQLHLNLREPLPEPLLKFNDDAVSGKPPAKKGKQGKPVPYAVRNMAIMHAIETAMRLDPERNPTRNDKRPEVSLCDIVSDCLKERGITANYGSVKTVWTESRKMRAGSPGSFYGEWKQPEITSDVDR